MTPLHPPALWPALAPATRQQLLTLWTELLYRQVRTRCPHPHGGSHAPVSQDSSPPSRPAGRRLRAPIHPAPTPGASGEYPPAVPTGGDRPDPRLAPHPDPRD